MKKRIINIRGANGSGKTTVLRNLAQNYELDCEVILVGVADHKPIPVTFCNSSKIAIVGDYSKESNNCTTSGCDRIKTQSAAKEVLDCLLRAPSVEVVLFEGIIVSTIYEPWKLWAEKHGGMTWAFLDTPLDVCLERIQKRNGGKEIKEDLVAGKVNTITRVREKAEADKLHVVTIDHKNANFELYKLLNHSVNKATV